MAISGLVLTSFRPAAIRASASTYTHWRSSTSRSGYGGGSFGVSAEGEEEIRGVHGGEGDAMYQSAIASRLPHDGISLPPALDKPSAPFGPALSSSGRPVFFDPIDWSNERRIVNTCSPFYSPVIDTPYVYSAVQIELSARAGSGTTDGIKRPPASRQLRANATRPRNRCVDRKPSSIPPLYF